jgi:hypothetical protein
VDEFEAMRRFTWPANRFLRIVDGAGPPAVEFEDMDEAAPWPMVVEAFDVAVAAVAVLLADGIRVCRGRWCCREAMTPRKKGR